MSSTNLTSATIPPALSLEYYRKQAKALLKSYTAADSHAISRVAMQLPNRADTPLALADAQWVVAREQGFASWPRFKRPIDEAGERAPVPIPPPLVDPSPKPSAQAPGIGSDAVFAGTGQHWAEWFTLLDAAGCARMSHKEIVAVVNEHCGKSWWRQMVAVEYERARGLRDTNMNCEGDYSVSVSRTVGAPAATMFDAWNDPAQREAWLPGAEMTIRKAVPCKRLILTWGKGGSVTVDVTPKADGRCQCVVDHKKLASADDVENYRAFWSGALDRLKTAVEA